MENQEATSKGSVFISCQKDAHYSREVILPQHALVHIFSGVMEISYGVSFLTFHSGDTVLIPHNQLGRLAKIPVDNMPFKSVSVLFPEELLRKFYAAHPVTVWPGHVSKHRAIAPHPLLESLFNSLLPYFSMHEELPGDIAEVKILEALTVIYTVDKPASQILGSFQEPGKIDLADYMEQHFMYNLPLEKFAYLTGRSLTTFKKDFRQAFKSPPGRWLTSKRLELAHYQLAVKKKKPSDVYLDAGFENLSHFSFAFKRQFGYNPINVPAG